MRENLFVKDFGMCACYQETPFMFFVLSPVKELCFLDNVLYTFE